MSKAQYKRVEKILRKAKGKKHINLTVDRKNFEKAKEMGYNISEVLERFLDYLVNRKEGAKKLK